MKDTEIIWAAGFFDGEGYSGMVPTKKGDWVGYYLKLAVGQKDRRPLDRFHLAVGGSGAIYGPYSHNPGWAPMYYWKDQGASAEAVMDLLLPHLSEPKREQWAQAQQALAALPTSRCQCGCGEWARPGNAYIHLHHLKPKLTKEQAVEIRGSHDRGVDLARRYHVSPQTICDIRKGRKWALL